MGHGFVLSGLHFQFFSKPVFASEGHIELLKVKSLTLEKNGWCASTTLARIEMRLQIRPGDVLYFLRGFFTGQISFPRVGSDQSDPTPARET